MNENLNPEKENFSTEELDVEKKLRPISFDDFAGQDQILENLQIFVENKMIHLLKLICLILHHDQKI